MIKLPHVDLRTCHLPAQSGQDVALRSIYHRLKPGGRIGLQFSWFVPESAEAYTDLLRQIQFKNVVVREVESFYIFKMALTAIGFFNSVGFDLFLEPLSMQDGIMLKNKINKQIACYQTESGIRLDFQRLYVQASYQRHSIANKQ